MNVQIQLIWLVASATAATASRNLRCEGESILCSDGSKCIEASKFCDRNGDCHDGSDEYPLRNVKNTYEANVFFCRGKSGHICVIPKSSKPRVEGACEEDWQCKRNEFECADGSRCIGRHNFCDGEINCSDGSDEYPMKNVNNTYDANVFFCRGETGNICVVPEGSKPRAEGVCKEDWHCKSNELQCADGSRCIYKHKLCNGNSDCRDGSDEFPMRNVNKSYDANSIFCRTIRRFVCVVPNSSWSRVQSICNTDWQCRSDEIQCEDGSKCISAEWYCDGYKDCLDGSDEPPLRNISNKYGANSTFCQGLNGRICAVPKTPMPNVTGRCREDWQCKSYEFECADGSRCIHRVMFCDRSKYCKDGSDEPPLRNISKKYDENSIFCRGWLGHICVVQKTALPQMTGVCQKNWQCKSNEFECADGSRCLKNSKFCDETKDCRDGSDEILRSRAKYKENEIYYQGGVDRICVMTDALSAFKDQICAIKNNSCTCKFHGRHVTENGCFRCLSNLNFVLQVSQICDGTVDCPDLSDECLCPSKNRLGICQTIDDTKTQRPNVPMTCRSLNRSQLIVDETMICDKREDCYDGADEKGCLNSELLTISAQQESTSYSECDFAKDLRPCNETKLSCEDCLCIPNHDSCDYMKDHTDAMEKFQRCFPNLGVLGEPLCDGRKHCLDGIDEKYCNTTRFYCTDEPVPNIPLSKRCNVIEDCVNGADELGCAHYYCSNNGTVKFIPRSSIADGVDDCEFGIDECLSVDSVFSDRISMISNKLVLAFVWIISIFAIVGCLAVIATTIRDLTRPQKSHNLRSSDHTRLFKILILSLSMSDFLVAVYTLVICVEALQLDHDYCKTDRSWRGSSTCSSLGVILVLGSEQSVFTMVLIAVLRTYVVWRPFAQPNIRAAILAVLVTWIMSITLATVPLTPSLEDYFVKNIHFQGNGLLTAVSTYDVQYTIDWLSLMPEANFVGTTDWSKLRNLAMTVNPSTTFIEFGYYSSHTVCLPTFFPKTSEEPAWHYTLFLILINFLAFLTMLVLYVILYRLASQRKVLQESVNAVKKQQEANVKMQRKLTRIVASDFFCWMPICVMGLMQICGVQIPRDAYLPAGLLIIPINSALNPLLYSDIPDFVLRKCKEAKDKIRCHSASNEPGEMEMKVAGRQQAIRDNA